MAGWYDACVSMFPSPERINSFNFSMPFTPQIHASLHYRAGETIEDPANIIDKTIGMSQCMLIYITKNLLIYFIYIVK